jgi:phage shock protein C
MKKRLYKSRTDKKLDGICGGIAEYFGIDPTLVRLAWVLFTALGGSGIVAYIICMIVFPEKPENIVDGN